MSFDVTVQPFAECLEVKANETILDAVLRHGLYLRYGCRNGGCGTCKVFLTDGEIEEFGGSFALPAAEQDQGWILTCMSVPADDCVIDVSTSELSEDEFRAGDQAGTFLCEVRAIERLTRDIRRVELRITDGSMQFVPGQFVNVTIPGSDRHRSFSMANAIGDGTGVELIIKVLPGGAFSSWVESEARPGDRVAIHGPHGDLKIRRSHRNILMVAGGSGMAPILAMLRQLAEAGNTRPIKFFFGARTVEDLYLQEEILELARSMPLEFIPVLSESWDKDWTGETGMVTEALARLVNADDPHDAYLCGPPPMIEAAKPVLRDLGVRERNIYFDAFAPTG